MSDTSPMRESSFGVPASPWIAPLVFLLSLLAAMLPYAIQGTAAIVVAHDHLDANFVWATVLAEQGLVFASADALVPPILGGLERHFFGSSIQLYYWIFQVLPPFQAMVAVEALTRAIAFIGVFLFAKDLLFRAPADPATLSCLSKRDSTLLAALAAAAFALLPFWPAGGAAVAGTPWFFWAAITIRSGPTQITRVLLIVAGVVLFVLFGSLVLSGLFALAFTSMVLVSDLVRRRWKQAFRLFLFNAIVAALFLFQNIDLIGIFSSQALTTRHEMIRSGVPSGMLGVEILKNFVLGQYHAFPGVIWPMLAAIALALLGVGLPLLRHSEVKGQIFYLVRAILAGLAAISFTALCYGMWRWSVVQDLIHTLKLPVINFGRFHWLQPGLWSIVFTAALAVIWSAKAIMPQVAGTRRLGDIILRHGRSVAMALALVQIVSNLMALPVYGTPDDRLWRFNAFLAPSLFDEIGARLGTQADVARLGLIGMHPAIAQFNGLAAVGGYLQVYPLETKAAFRQIIAGELDKSAKFRSYFDNWGSRAYLFAADLEDCVGACTADRAPDSITVDFDMAAFQRFGGTHLLSVSKVANAGKLGLRELGVFKSESGEPHEIWRVYLYALD